MDSDKLKDPVLVSFPPQDSWEPMMIHFRGEATYLSQAVSTLALTLARKTYSDPILVIDRLFSHFFHELGDDAPDVLERAIKQRFDGRAPWD